MATEEGASLLKGCTVYVWALDGGDVMTYGGLTAKVKGFGGKVVSRLTKEVTHIIFHRKHSPLPRERLQEDDAIRHFYRTIEPHVSIVSPLWLGACEKKGIRAKEKRYVVAEPKMPLFLDQLKTGSTRHRNRSADMRPRELVEVDADNPLFSSSQQIRDLNEAPNLSSGDRPGLLYGVISEKNKGKQCRPLKLPELSMDTTLPVATQKAKSQQRPAAVATQQHGAKRPMRQLALSFTVLNKKPRQASAEGDGIAKAGTTVTLPPLSQQPAHVLQPVAEVQSQKRWLTDSGGGAAAATVARVSCISVSEKDTTSFADGPNPQPAPPPPPPPKSMRKIQKSSIVETMSHDVLVLGAPTTARKAHSCRAQSYAAVPGSAGSAPVSKSLPPQPGNRNSLDTQLAAAAAAAANEGDPKPTSLTAVLTRDTDCIAVLTPRGLAMQKSVLDEVHDGRSPIDGGSVAAAALPAAATAAPRQAPSARKMARNSQAAVGLPTAEVEVVTEPAHGAHIARLDSSRRRSRSVAGTPLSAGLGRSMSQLTPMGLTPGILVMPKLKSQGNAAMLAIAASPYADADNQLSATPQRVNAAPGAQTKTQALAGLMGDAAVAAISSDLTPRLKMDTSAGRKSCEVSEERAVVDNAHQVAVAAPRAPASIRCSARIRGQLPPTPPPQPHLAGAVPLSRIRAAEQNARLQSSTRESAELGTPAGVPKLDIDASGPVAAGAVATETPTLFGRVLAGMATGGGSETDGEAGVAHAGTRPTDEFQCSQRNASPCPPQMSSMFPSAGNSSECEAEEQDPSVAPAMLKYGTTLGPAHDGGPAPMPTATPLCGGVISASVVQRSAWLTASSLLVSAPPERQPGDKVAIAPVQGAAAESPSSRQELSPGAGWGGFQFIAQQQPAQDSSPPPLQHSQPKLRREIASLLKSDSAVLTRLDRHAAGAGCTPVTRYKTRRCRNGGDLGREGDVHPPQPSQQQAPTPSLKPDERRAELTGQGHREMALAAPSLVAASPALCTRSRARAAMTASPSVVLVNAAQQPLGLPPRHLASSRSPPEQHDCPRESASNLTLQPKKDLERLPAAGGGTASPSRRIAHATPGPSIVDAMELRFVERPGSATRSRCRALLLELADAAQAPAGTASNRLQRNPNPTPELLEVAQGPKGECSDLSALYTAAVEVRPRSSRPTAASSADTVGSVLPAALPPRPTPARKQAAVNNMDFNDTMLQPSIIASAAAGLIAALPAIVTPNVAAAAGEPLPSAEGIPPRPPRTSAQKRLRNALTDARSALVRGEAGGRSGSAMVATDAHASGGRCLQVGASTDPNAAREAPSEVCTDPAAAQGPPPVVPSTGGEAASRTIVNTGPLAAACRPQRPLLQSRLRLTKRPLTASPRAADATAGTVLKGAIGPSAAVQQQLQPAPKRRRTMLGLTTQAASQRTGETCGAGPPAFDAVQATEDCAEPAARQQLKAVKTAPSESKSLHVPEAEPGGPRQPSASKACSGGSDATMPAKRRTTWGAALLRFVYRPRGPYGSLVLTGTPSEGAVGSLAPRSASMHLGTGAAAHKRLGTAEAGAAAPRQVLEPSLVGSKEAMAPSLALTLGQYPRGKEHPMRAGYWYLACTRVGKEMEATIEQAVKQLGSARLCTPGYEDGHLTHLVVGDAGARTVKVLMGIANGALFVAPSWVEASLAAGAWLPEKNYLVKSAFAETADAVRAQLQAQQPRGDGSNAPAVQGAIVAKPLGGRMVAIHKSQCAGFRLGELRVKRAELEAIIKALGGRLGPVRSADLLIVLGSSTLATAERRPERRMVTEKWLLQLAETHIWQDYS